MYRHIRSLPRAVAASSAALMLAPAAFAQDPDCFQFDLQCFTDHFPPASTGGNNLLLGIEDGFTYSTGLPAGSSSGAIAWDFTGDELPDVLTEIAGTAHLVVAAGLLDLVIDLPLPAGSSYVSSVGYSIQDSGDVLMIGSTDAGAVTWAIDPITGDVSTVVQSAQGGGSTNSDWADATWIRTGDLDGDGHDDDIYAYFQYPAPQGGFVSALRTGTVDGSTGTISLIAELELGTYVAAGCTMDWSSDPGDELVLAMGSRFFALDETFGIEAFAFMPHQAVEVAPIADAFGVGASFLLREPTSGGTADHIQVVRPGAGGPVLEALTPLGVTDIDAMIVADGIIQSPGDLLLAGDDVYALSNESGNGQVTYTGNLLPNYSDLVVVGATEGDDDTRWLVAPDIDDDGDRDPMRAGSNYLSTASSGRVLEALRQPLVNADANIRYFSDVAIGGGERVLTVELRNLFMMQLFGATHVECQLFVEGNGSEYAEGRAPTSSSSNDSINVSMVYDYTPSTSTVGTFVARGVQLDANGDVVGKTAAVVYEVLLAAGLGGTNEGNAPLRPLRLPPIVTSNGKVPHKRPTSSGS